MHAEVIRDDGKNPMGIMLQQNQEGDNPILERFFKEGITPVSFNPKEGLLCAFGRSREPGAENESEEDEPPVEASRWVG